MRNVIVFGFPAYLKSCESTQKYSSVARRNAPYPGRTRPAEARGRGGRPAHAPRSPISHARAKAMALPPAPARARLRPARLPRARRRRSGRAPSLRRRRPPTTARGTCLHAAPSLPHHLPAPPARRALGPSIVALLLTAESADPSAPFVTSTHMHSSMCKGTCYCHICLFVTASRCMGSRPCLRPSHHGQRCSPHHKRSHALVSCSASCKTHCTLCQCTKQIWHCHVIHTYIQSIAFTAAQHSQQPMRSWSADQLCDSAVT